MKHLGYVQRFGMGIPTAKSLLKEAGHPELEFEINDNYVLATIKGSAKILKGDDNARSSFNFLQQ